MFEFQCSKCIDPILNTLRIVIVILGVLLLVVLLIRSTLASAVQKKSVSSVYLKILMNHMQLIFLTVSFNFDWPDNVVGLLSFSKPFSQASTQVFSFDCLLNASSSQGQGNGYFRLYYVKMLMFALLPCVLMFFCICFWSFYYGICAKDKKQKF